MQLLEAIDEFNQWRDFKTKRNTNKGYCAALKHFCMYWRNPDIENIQLPMVIEYLNNLRVMGWTDNGILGKSMALRKLFEFYSLQGYPVINYQLIPIPSKEYSLPRVADDEHYLRLLSVIPNNNDPRHIRNKAIVTMLHDSGCRVGELCSLDQASVNLEKGSAILKTEKVKIMPYREIFWTKETNGLLQRWVQKREYLRQKIEFRTPALFISCVSQKRGERFTIKGVGEMLRRYCDRAEIPALNAHSFRHRVGKVMAMQGANNSTISSILGHTSLQSSYTYTKLFGADLKEQYEKYLQQY